MGIDVIAFGDGVEGGFENSRTGEGAGRDASAVHGSGDAAGHRDFAAFGSDRVCRVERRFAEVDVSRLGHAADAACVGRARRVVAARCRYRTREGAVLDGSRTRTGVHGVLVGDDIETDDAAGDHIAFVGAGCRRGDCARDVKIPDRAVVHSEESDAREGRRTRVSDV